MCKEDTIVDIEMYFNQIISLVDLMLNGDELQSPNLLTLRDLAELGLSKIKS